MFVENECGYLFCFVLGGHISFEYMDGSLIAYSNSRGYMGRQSQPQSAAAA